jgi:hypothetical protein
MVAITAKLIGLLLVMSVVAETTAVAGINSEWYCYGDQNIRISVGEARAGSPISVRTNLKYYGAYNVKVKVSEEGGLIKHTSSAVTNAKSIILTINPYDPYTKTFFELTTDKGYKKHIVTCLRINEARKYDCKLAPKNSNGIEGQISFALTNIGYDSEINFYDSLIDPYENDRYKNSPYEVPKESLLSIFSEGWRQGAIETQVDRILLTANNADVNGLNGTKFGEIHLYGRKNYSNGKFLHIDKTKKPYEIFESPIKCK